MHFTSALATFLLPALALGAPGDKRASAVSMAADDNAQWILQSVHRDCDAADTSCTWSFVINSYSTGEQFAKCQYVVKSSGSTPASQSPETGVTCGAFTISSGWSGQFGAGNGFTTLSIVDYAAKLIAWPAYSDSDLANNKIVTPDRSFPVQKLS